MSKKNIFELIAMLGIEPKKDGDQWFFLWGENIAEGVSGFGETVELAAMNFNFSVENETTNGGDINNG